MYRSSICVYLIRGRQKKYKSTNKSPEHSRSIEQRHVAKRLALWDEQNNAHYVFHFQKYVSIFTKYFFTLMMSFSLNIDPNMTKLLQLLTHMAYTRPNNYEGWNFNSGNYLFTTDTK